LLLHFFPFAQRIGVAYTVGANGGNGKTASD
jgi:hypothetical protein